MDWKCSDSIVRIGTIREKYFAIIRGMITHLIVRMRLGIWLLGWKTGQVLDALRNKLRLVNTILSRFRRR